MGNSMRGMKTETLEETVEDPLGLADFKTELLVLLSNNVPSLSDSGADLVFVLFCFVKLFILKLF